MLRLSALDQSPVRSTQSPAEAIRETLALAVDREPDVVVLDLGMPGVDGYGVVTRLRRENGFDKVAFVAVTGSGLPEDLRRTREAGFDAHLVKPVTLGTLRQVLERF